MKGLAQEITPIIKKYPATRNSTEVLYAEYLHRHGIKFTGVWNFFMGFKEYKVSNFETVARVRRKIVEKYPYLKGVEQVEKARHDKECEMWDYAKGIGND